MTATDGSTYFAVTTLAVVGFVVFYVWLALGLTAVFRKSGEEPWRAWVPVLNLVVLLRLGGLSGWLLLLALIPFAGLIAVWVAVVIACHRIGAAFGFGPGMTVLAALLLPVWASVIGFGASRWVGAEAPVGTRRTSAETDDGLAFLAGITDQAGYAPKPPSAGPSRAYAAGDVASPPPKPPLPAASTTGWVPPPPPPPLPAPAIPTVSAAASASPPVPPRPSYTSSAQRWEGLHPADELTGEVTGAVPGAPSPISAIPVAPDYADEEVAAGPLGAGPRRGAQAPAADPPVTHVPAPAPAPAAQPAEPWAPMRSPMAEPGAFAETSGPVSAIVGAPDAGSPRSARGSVSALHSRPEIPEEAIEQTVITSRRRTAWSLVPPSGEAIPLSTEVVILGRRPVADPEFPGAQLIAIQDGTVSKTHARLELRDDAWYITDLDSTNGVLFATLMGTEVEATPGVAVEAGDSFLLGDAEVRLQRSDG
ncbi:DUF5684 domain-containing protein [Microbacterium deminutum]|uniref:FHA domain-containing protein n=1 Tax=Microbacterium deminutum TaxID=344164 RepID=A0ABN2Q4Z3_9MICO